MVHKESESYCNYEKKCDLGNELDPEETDQSSLLHLRHLALRGRAAHEVAYDVVEVESLLDEYGSYEY